MDAWSFELKTITNIRCTFRQAILGQALGYYVRLHEEICSEYHMSQKIGTKISCILTNRKVFSFRIYLIAQTSLLGFPQAKLQMLTLSIAS